MVGFWAPRWSDSGRYPSRILGAGGRILGIALITNLYLQSSYHKHKITNVRDGASPLTGRGFGGFGFGRMMNSRKAENRQREPMKFHPFCFRCHGRKPATRADWYCERCRKLIDAKNRDEPR